MNESFERNQCRNHPRGADLRVARRAACRRWPGSPWGISARHGVAAVLGALIILSGAGQVLGASAPVAIPALTSARQEEDPSDAPPSASDRANTSTTAEILERQGVQGFESLLAVAAYDVENPYPAPVDIEATRAAEAQAAAATATAAAHEAAVAATVTAEARQAAAVATATAVATELRNTQATATAEARPERMAAVRATWAALIPKPAAVSATAPTQRRAVLGMDGVSLVSLALLPVLSGALGIRLWQRHKEPFAIKAKPGKG